VIFTDSNSSKTQTLGRPGRGEREEDGIGASIEIEHNTVIFQHSGRHFCRKLILLLVPENSLTPINGWLHILMTG
jgi:hypothetical protein